MDHFLTSYGLDRDVMNPFLQRDSVLLAGSAALALYLEQEGGDEKVGFEPGDMDLWVSAMDQDTEDELVWMLQVKGYLVKQVANESDLYMERLTRIQRVVTLEDGDSEGQPNKIQVIRVAAEDLKEYALNHFDLSACMTWWDHRSERFVTMYPLLTNARQLFVRQTQISQAGSARLTERIEKYKGRGFEVVAEPPPFLSGPDERKEEDLDVWKGVKAFDVFAYEEVDAADHLGSSRLDGYHILLGCGDAWYAFDRKALISYMEGKQIEEGHILLFETPFRQYVGFDAWDSLAYSDDSIYRLVDPHDRVVKGQNRTIYAVEGYSCLGWRDGIPNGSFPFQDPEGVHVEDGGEVIQEPEGVQDGQEVKEDQEMNPQDQELLAEDQVMDQIEQELLAEEELQDLLLLLSPPDVHLYHQFLDYLAPVEDGFLEWIHADDSWE